MKTKIRKWRDKYWSDPIIANEIALCIISSEKIYISTPSSSCTYPIEDLEEALSFYGGESSLKKLQEFSMKKNGEFKNISSKGSEKWKVFLNPKMALEYDDKTCAVRIRTTFASTSNFKFKNSDDYIEFKTEIKELEKEN